MDKKKEAMSDLTSAIE